MLNVLLGDFLTDAYVVAGPAPLRAMFPVTVLKTSLCFVSEDQIHDLFSCFFITNMLLGT